MEDKIQSVILTKHGPSDNIFLGKNKSLSLILKVLRQSNRTLMCQPYTG